MFEGKWDQMKGKIKEEWGKLTDDDLAKISGKRDELVGKLKERYGWARDYVEKELSRWEKTFDNEEEGTSSDSEDEEMDYNEGRTRSQK